MCVMNFLHSKTNVFSKTNLFSIFFKFQFKLNFSYAHGTDKQYKKSEKFQLILNPS